MRRPVHTPILWPLLAPALLIAGCGDANPASTKAPPPPPRPAKAHPAVGTGQRGVKLTKLGDFDQPLYVTQPPRERGDLFVVERGGAIRVIHDGKPAPQPFLDLSDKLTTEDQEQGLLSMAFAPDYRRSGRFYVDYTDRRGDTRVVEYRRSSNDPLRADPSSARLILAVNQPFSNHNGGLVLFGPDDKLYIGLGDGGSADDPNRVGQDLSSPLAKILRVDPRPRGGRPYSIPPDNPFVGQSGDRPETYLYGLRNPWRFSFDRLTRALTIGDVGQDEFEEIDYVRGDPAGDNFGWSAYEGNARFNKDQSAPGAVRPILVYSHDTGGCSVTGGYVVRDPALRSLYGRYLYGDFCVGELRSFIPALPTADDDRALGLTVPQLSSFGEDNAGHIYATSLEGPVYRLDPAP
jgi:glucose/arabinose dehydrogenase